MTNPKLIPFDGERHLTVPALTRIAIRLADYIKSIDPSDTYKQFQVFEAESLRSKIRHFLERKSRGGVCPSINEFLIDSIKEFNADDSNPHKIQGEDERCQEADNSYDAFLGSYFGEVRKQLSEVNLAVAQIQEALTNSKGMRIPAEKITSAPQREDRSDGM